MIRKQSDYRIDERPEMRGGNGTVRIEHLFEAGTELKSPTRLCARLYLEPGVSIGFHRHENEEEIFVIVKGEGEIDDNGTLRQVAAGDSVLTGNGAGHAVRNTGSETLEILAVISKYAE
jgi:mannose-6-phosphate isomerase-like protein (cupin superfamily)